MQLADLGGWMDCVFVGDCCCVVSVQAHELCVLVWVAVSSVCLWVELSVLSLHQVH